MTDLTNEAVTIGLDDERIKFFADRLLEVARINAAAESCDGESDKEDLASYAGEVVALRRALLAARAIINGKTFTVDEAQEAIAQARADAEAAVALALEEAADLHAKLWRETSAYKEARIRAIAPASALAKLAALRAERDEALMAANQQDALRAATLATMRSVSAENEDLAAEVARLRNAARGPCPVSPAPADLSGLTDGELARFCTAMAHRFDDGCADHVHRLLFAAADRLERRNG